MPATVAEPSVETADDALEIVLDEHGEVQGDPVTPQKVTWVDKVEAYLSKLSTRDNFWHRVFSLLFLPLAFWSGIRMRKTGASVSEDETSSFAAVLPFKKFNKNWYNAMAGASLLANTEIAAGMYVFGEAGGDYTVVCKNLNYTFLRPCLGPAVYRMTPQEDLKAQIAAGGEFNTSLDVDVRQLGLKSGDREKRVGRAEITFHVTPKRQAKQRKSKLKERDKRNKRLKNG
jgi:acyl-coenzyme A thioesterase PaaI-like protein